MPQLRKALTSHQTILMQSTILQQQLTIAEIRQQIIDLLHLDEERFHHTLYQVGLQYLHEYLGDEDILMTSLPAVKSSGAGGKQNGLNVTSCTPGDIEPRKRFAQLPA
jgi:hypothetical protein